MQINWAIVAKLSFDMQIPNFEKSVFEKSLKNLYSCRDVFKYMNVFSTLSRYLMTYNLLIAV